MAGDGVALLALGIVAASILRGMHLPLGLWPRGPWRSQFPTTVLVGAAVVFGALVVVFAPEAPLRAQLDSALFVTVVVGVLAWGGAWAMVRQRSYVPWYGLAVGLALVPFVVAVLAAVAGEGQVCLVVVRSVEQGTPCEAPALPTLVFLTAVLSPALLVTFEIAFRRLLMGQPDHAGLVLVFVAALVHAGWLALVAPTTPAIGVPWWVGGGVAVGAGSLYALSRSLLVSSIYSAVAFASYEALSRAAPMIPGTVGEPVDGWAFRSAAVFVTLGLGAVVVRRCGVLTGTR